MASRVETAAMGQAWWSYFGSSGQFKPRKASRVYTHSLLAFSATCCGRRALVGHWWQIYSEVPVYFWRNAAPRVTEISGEEAPRRAQSALCPKLPFPASST